MRELDKYELSVLSMKKMKGCRPSTSPNLEKQTEPGDDDPCDHPNLHRFAVSTILSMTRRRSDLQATARWTCKRLRDPNQKSGRQLVKTVACVRCRKELATLHAEVWQGRQELGLQQLFTGNLRLGWYLIVGGCRLHSRCRTTGQRALSSGESETMSMSELMKEAKLTQQNLDFCGMGLLPNRLAHRCGCRKRMLSQKRCGKTEASGREKLLIAGGTAKRVDRKFNASDTLSHCPSAEELRKFHDWLPHSDSDEENVHSVELMLKGMLAAKVTVFFASLAETLNS